MPSVTEITVRYAETDCMGVTHHAVYPVWFEVARTDYIKNAAVSYAEMERRGGMIPVTGISCKYRQPSRYDDTLEITTYVTRFSPARVEFRYECRRKGSPEILRGHQRARIRGRRDVPAAELQEGSAGYLRKA